MLSSSYTDEEKPNEVEEDLHKNLADLIQGKNTTQSLDFILPISHQYKRIIGGQAIDALVFFVSSFYQDLINLNKVLAILLCLVDDDSSDSISNAALMSNKDESILTISECFSIKEDISIICQSLSLINRIAHLQKTQMQNTFIQNDQFQKNIINLFDNYSTTKSDMQKIFYETYSIISQDNNEIDKLFANVCLNKFISCLTSEKPSIPDFFLAFFQVSTHFQDVFVENGHLEKFIPLIEDNKLPISLLNLLFTSENANSYRNYLENSPNLFSLIVQRSISMDDVEERHLYIMLLSNMVNGNQKLCMSISTHIKIFFEIGKKNSFNQNEIKSFLSLFECFAKMMPTDYLIVLRQNIEDPEFFTNCNAKKYEISFILQSICIGLISNRTFLPFFFDPQKNDNFYNRSLQLLSNSSITDDPSNEILLISLLMLISSTLWESKIISKSTLTSLSSLKRTNGQTAIYFLTSLSQQKGENEIKSISSFILLEMLMFLSNSKASSAAALKNNVDSYANSLSLLKVQDYWSRFIVQSFEIMRNMHNSDHPIVLEEVNDAVQIEFRRLQQELEYINREFSETKEKMQKEIDELKRENECLQNQNKANINEVDEGIMENERNNEKLYEISRVKIANLEKTNNELLKSKVSADAIQTMQIQLLQHENQELKGKLKANEENGKIQIQFLKRENQDLKQKIKSGEDDEALRLLVESDHKENERLTNKLEKMKQMKNEIHVNNETDKLKCELRVANMQISDMKEEIAKLKSEKQSLEKKETEFTIYRDKLLDAKIQIIAFKKENSQLKETIKKFPKIEVDHSNEGSQIIESKSESISNPKMEENFSNEKIIEFKLLIESLRQQISEKDLINAQLKATQLSMTNVSQNEINNLTNINQDLNKQIELLKSNNVEMKVQMEFLKQKIESQPINEGIFHNKETLNDENEKILQKEVEKMRVEIEEIKPIQNQNGTLKCELEIAKNEIITLKKEKAEIMHFYDSKSRNDENDSISSLNQKTTLLENEIKKLSEHIVEKEKKICELENTTNSPPLIASLQNQLNEKNEKIIELSEVNKELMREKDNLIQSKNIEIKKLEKLLNDTENRINNPMIANLEKKIIELQNEIENLKFSRNESPIKNEVGDLNELKEQVEYYKLLLSEREETIQNPQNIKDLQTAKILKEITKLRKQRLSLKEQIESLNKSESSKELQISTLRNQIKIYQQLQITENAKDQEILNLQNQVDEMQKTNEEKTTLLDERDNKINELQKEIEVLSNNSQSILNSNIESNNANPTQTQTQNGNTINNSIQNKIADHTLSEIDNFNLTETDNLRKQIIYYQGQNEGLKRKALDLETQISDLKNKESEHGGKLIEIEQKESELGKKEAEIKNKEAELKNQENELLNLKIELKKQETDLEISKSELNHQKIDFESKEYELNNKEAKNKSKESVREYNETEKLNQKNQIEQLNYEVLLKDEEINTLQNEISSQKEQISEFEKIHNMYLEPPSLMLGAKVSDDLSLNELFSKSQEINRLNLLVLDLQDKIDDLSYQLKEKDGNTFQNISSFNKNFETDQTETAELNQKIEYLEKELEKQQYIQQIENENSQKIKQDMNKFLIKYQEMQHKLQMLKIKSEKSSYEAGKLGNLEKKHQAALKLIGKLWSRNQSLLYENGGNAFQITSEKEQFSPDELQFL